MKSLRSLTIVGCLLACSAPATSHAFAIAAGWTDWDHDAGNGANLQLYPQWEVGFGLSPELQIGVHWAMNSLPVQGTAHSLYIPAMVGLRWDLGKVLPLGILGPFVGAHLGYARTEEIISGTGTSFDGSGGDNNFAFNFVAGLNFDLGDTVAIGVQGGADVIVPSNSGDPQVHVYSVNAILTL